MKTKLSSLIKYAPLTLIILICGRLNCNAQHIDNYENFLGTWEYKTENEHFILKTKIREFTKDGKNGNMLLGVFKYVKDGVTIYDRLGSFDTLSFYVYPIIAFSAWENWGSPEPQTKLYTMYNDCETDCSAESWKSPLIFIPGNPAQLSWHLELDEWIELIFEDDEGDEQEQTTSSNTPVNGIPVDGTELGDRPEDEKPFTIPADMILTKIE